MHAKELMIGDWVKIVLTTSHSVEISQNVIEKYTSSKEQIIRCGNVMSNSIAYNKYSENFKINISIPVVEEDIHPIPLTPEILELNGFCKNFSERYIQRSVPFEVNIRENNKYITLSGKYFCNCDYIHQLQQALRLCGLNELADNFKVD